jgi:hypothetical protein
MRDFTLDLIKGNLTVEEAEELLAKAKYTRRWRGSDGKWRYEYKKPAKKRSARSEPAGEHEGHAIAAMDEEKVRKKMLAFAKQLKDSDRALATEGFWPPDSVTPQQLAENRDGNDNWLDFAADALGVDQADARPSAELVSAARYLRMYWSDAVGLGNLGRWSPEERPKRPVTPSYDGT